MAALSQTRRVDDVDPPGTSASAGRLRRITPIPTTSAPSPAPAADPGSGAATPVTTLPVRPMSPLPPDHPLDNIPPTPDFLLSCSAAVTDQSTRCTAAALDAIDHARAIEGLGPMVLPAGWASLSPASQLYVATNLERTARGLAPLAGESTSLDGAAAASAATSDDAVPPRDLAVGRWGSNWAGNLGNALEVVYYWVYDDGQGSPNVTCTPATPDECWGHRDNLLVTLSCPACAIGVATDPTGLDGRPTWAEILAETPAGTPLTLPWAQVVAGAG